jgi:AcrR family transcriptional regulator
MAAGPPGRHRTHRKGERTSPSARSRKPARAPQQARSLQTRERLLAAAEALFAARDYAEVSVDDIVHAAHSSVGAFYKHLPGKREMLPLLLERLDSQGNAQLEGLLRDPALSRAPLAARVIALLEGVAGAFLARRRLLRAFVAARFTTQLLLRPADVATARARMQAMREWLLERRGEIAHPEPEVAVRVGLYLVLQSLQTALLFEDLPAELPATRVVAEASQLLLAYLRSPGTPIGRPSA